MITIQKSVAQRLLNHPVYSVHMVGVFEETSDVISKYRVKESKLWKQLYHGGIVTRGRWPSQTF
jgi:hypothetical protein